MSASLGLMLLILLLLLLRQGLLVILGLTALYVHAFFGRGELTDVIVDLWDASNRDVLLAIPLYILAGNIMASGAMASRLVRVMRAVASPVAGGLAMASVLSCALFAAVSGSGTVTMLAVGAVMYPALLEAGYPRRFSLGALCSAGTLGILIPPSIPLMLYGIMTETSITELFLAGIGPGLLLTVLFTVYAWFRNRDRRGAGWNGREVATALGEGAWALGMPLVVLGGIYSGHFTATESAAVAVAYALAVEVLVYRELGAAGLVDVVTRTAELIGALFPVLLFALSINVFLTYEQVPDRLVAWLGGQLTEPVPFLIGVNLLLLAVGCIMDIGSAILILAPILAPLAVSLGIDPVHFGIVMVVNLEIGYLTPPVGMNLVVATTAYRESFREVCVAVLPFVLIMLLALGLVTAWPGLSLFLLG
ncbi:MAG: TRAP transporter large permease [Gammaproteobacteria bacterium]|nr:TRAP transporter large permease [Gammaproteobacteria bacterium]